MSRLAAGTLISAIGNGAWYTSWAIFLTRWIGLSPAVVGLGMTVAGACGVAAATPLGWIADRVGARDVRRTARAPGPQRRRLCPGARRGELPGRVVPGSGRGQRHRRAAERAGARPVRSRGPARGTRAAAGDQPHRLGARGDRRWRG